MFERNRRPARAGLKRLAGVGVCAGVIVAVPAIALAGGPPPPVSQTTCFGKLTPDRSGAAQGESNLLDYSFSCDGKISAYSIVVDRRAGDSGNVDDFNPSPVAYGPDGVTPASAISVTCEATTPSDGLNCNFGAGELLPDFNFVDGTVDPVAPYCKSLPADAKPRTPAVPQAIVQLVVTDATGAQDGPFKLVLRGSCPKVPNFAPASGVDRHRHRRH